MERVHSSLFILSFKDKMERVHPSLFILFFIDKMERAHLSLGSPVPFNLVFHRQDGKGSLVPFHPVFQRQDGKGLLGFSSKYESPCLELGRGYLAGRSIEHPFQDLDRRSLRDDRSNECSFQDFGRPSLVAIVSWKFHRVDLSQRFNCRSFWLEPGQVSYERVPLFGSCS